MAENSTSSRRERPAKPALTRRGIVATAVAVMRAEGAERVTMRRLAKELDTGPASLYVYVKDTEELHAAMLDELLAEVDLGDGGAGEWRDRLWAVLGSYRSVLFAHPSLARVALVTRLSGSHYLAVVEAVLALLDEGGMPPGQAAWAVDVLLLIATATAVEHGSRQEKPGAEREHDVLVETLAGLSAQTYPHIAALGPDLVSGPGLSRARWAFDVLLNGALSTTRPRNEQR
ncbi:TetR/AcrR family transcriptional regulator [Amycolatopsis sp. NBC_00355]|uniref:TetR/AcrR family transcriptional regulator n=1 Tax=Amycolatopsis sp. NBC_00355 TaxID=2975957 RepID=UPI002E25C5C5